MQSRAFCRTTPHVYRVVKAAPSSARTMSLFPRSFGYPVVPASSLSPPFGYSHALGREIAPLFQAMDDLSRQFDSDFFPFTNATPRQRAPAPFAPRFDVREVDGAYELRGELPGVEPNNLQVEFTDAQTLIIRGRTESETTNGTPPSVEQAQTTEAVEETPQVTANAVADDAASVHSNSSYHKASVEDGNEDGVVVEREDAPTPGQATPAESVTSERAQTNPVQATADPAKDNNSTPTSPRYWVSERRTGSFQRVFSFPAKVDQEGVSASLKNGVLEVRVPKAIKQAPRKITVQ